MAKSEDVILDSSVWIAYINPYDSQHQKAVELLDSLSAVRIVVPEYVLVEVLTILQQQLGKKYANNFLNFAKSDDALILESASYFKGSLKLFPDCDNKLSFVDISLIYLSKYYNLRTFDKTLEKAVKKYAKKK